MEVNVSLFEWFDYVTSMGMSYVQWVMANAQCIIIAKQVPFGTNSHDELELIYEKLVISEINQNLYIFSFKVIFLSLVSRSIFTLAITFMYFRCLITIEIDNAQRYPHWIECVTHSTPPT